MRRPRFLNVRALVLIAICLITLAPRTWARSYRPRVKVTKGAPAKGPSDKTFSNTVNKRLESLGSPDDQTEALKAEQKRRVASLTTRVSDQKNEDAIIRQLDHMFGTLKQDINARDASGMTALHRAAEANLPRVVEHLLKKGADRSVRNMAGQTAAAIARQSAAHRTVVSLLEEPATRGQ